MHTQAVMCHVKTEGFKSSIPKVNYGTSSAYINCSVAIVQHLSTYGEVGEVEGGRRDVRLLALPENTAHMIIFCVYSYTSNTLQMTSNIIS